MIVKYFIHDPRNVPSVILGELIGGALSSCKACVCQSFTFSARSFLWESFLLSDSPSVCVDCVFAFVVWHHTCVQLSPWCRWVTLANLCSFLHAWYSRFLNLTSSCLFLLLFPQMCSNLVDFVVFSVPLYVRQHMPLPPLFLTSAGFLFLFFFFFFQARGQLRLGVR